MPAANDTIWSRMKASADAPMNCGTMASATPSSTSTQVHFAIFASFGGMFSSFGRHSAASTTRIGYSAIHENAYGAIRPENRPPTMPPNDSAT